MNQKSSSLIIPSLTFALIMTSLIILTLYISTPSFVEGYDNGFYLMQTTRETVSAFFGNIAFHIIHL